jgi:hypothetical protein
VDEDPTRSVPSTAARQGQSLLVLGGSSVYVLLLLQAIATATPPVLYNRITLFGRNLTRLNFVAKTGNAMMRLHGHPCEVDLVTNCSDLRT